MTNIKKVGARILELRKKLNLTQNEMGEKLNISFQAISKWERGEALPDTSILLSLAQVLETSIDDILTGGNEILNLVDERFELMSLIFRLAGRNEYNTEETVYQKALAVTFSSFKYHPAVEYAAKLNFGYDKVANYAVHLEKSKDGFSLLTSIDTLFTPFNNYWSKENATEFIPLINDFYFQSQFADFFNRHKSFYEAETGRFAKETYNHIDFEWFRQFINPSNLRCIYSPSINNNSYGASVGDVSYGIISNNGKSLVSILCFHFTNPIAKKWYDENENFKKWCHESYDPERMPTYAPGLNMAFQYVMRVHNILFQIHHGGELPPLLMLEKGSGFSYIEDVYAMVTTHEKTTLKGEDAIKQILACDYKISEEYNTFYQGEKLYKWRTITPSSPLPHTYLYNDRSNMYNTKTGDIILEENTGFLLIDLGCDNYNNQEGFRKYSRIPLYDFNKTLTLQPKEYRKHFNDGYDYSEMKEIIDRALTAYFS